MTTGIIIIVCALLIIAYIFDVTAAKTKIPSVILLLAMGWFVRQVVGFIGIKIPDLSPLLSVFGTIGLILIVLEGSLELELNKSKTKLIKNSLIVSFLPMFVLAFILAFMFQHYGGGSLKDGLTNAIPFCVISSAIAIPSVKSLTSSTQEFVIYETSFSDIIGVLFFNFVSLNAVIELTSFGNFSLELILIAVISFVSTIGLSLLLNKIEHRIKFAPIILIVILIYAISKVYHLPGLIFILLFGLFLGNLDELKRFKWIDKLNPDNLSKEVDKFKDLLIEGAFIIRALFFLLFGFLIETAEILNKATLLWAVIIVGLIFIIRGVHLKIMRLPILPLFYIAPRGLITILLFLSIDSSMSNPLVNKSLIIQVIILTTMVMMVGLILTKVERKPVNGELENKNIS